VTGPLVTVVVVNHDGAERGYQELDRGQYQRPEEVLAFCGGAVCFRTEALHEAGMFDEDSSPTCRLLPVMLVRQRRLAAGARVDRRRLERWLVVR
jgi:hypothetical protein